MFAATTGLLGARRRVVHRVVCLISCAVWIGYAGRLSAEPNPAPIESDPSAQAEDGPVEVIQITGTRVESELADVSVPVQVIDGHTLSERSPEVLTDAFREVPNVHAVSPDTSPSSPK